jgi:hypothetical protein
MASVIMTTALSGGQIEKQPDMGAMMRASMTMMANSPEMQVLAKSPAYLRETLISPYAEGASFVQAWAKANPGQQVVELFKRLPVSAEQILHSGKYLSGDIPHRIDLERVAQALPSGWEKHYHNTLGEFDLRVLFAENAPTKTDAVALAEGWDGLAFVSFRKADALVVLGVSVWDSEADAIEFAEALEVVMTPLHGEDGVDVIREGTRVVFVAGMLQGLPVSDILAALIAAPAAEVN